ncbi:3-oxoacyl-ACP reductase FabG [Taibaiella chishuiensis]|uniref:3-oxoacyl-[acyl-carrier protein] reductase n=1 Tax=Taibaiella chishuiensis TaxID=1434707 RepID=A0A2P8DB60_9BACT|nr:3-oxoacyl-ACP reductase FabG [Taibaiella chishuiensis]PSK94427.1 3-oxoacyl-[acyl-carrier protein] reductase [Taibaiella chishuiensis]
MKQAYALVTGGSRGIGRAICIKLATMGYPVIINYKGNKAAAEETARLVEAQGQAAVVLGFNVADREEIQQTLGKWQADNSDKVIAVLVNNAGVRQDALLAFMSDEQWDQVLDTSLQGMYNVTKQVMNPMLMNRSGRIINIVSLSGLKGMPGQFNYSAAKAGMIGATKALAQEVAKRNITVNAIAPGFVKTDMTEELNEKELTALIPMKRFGEAEEVAELAGFLASDKAGYITGQVISINGGLYT